MTDQPTKPTPRPLIRRLKATAADRDRLVKVNARLVEALEECSDWLEQRILDIIPTDDRPATQARIRLARTALDEASNP